MRVYIAGPMTGLPDSNYPAFNAAAALWRAAGWEVRNPAEHFGADQTRAYREYVEVDIAALKTCDAIAMLPGWKSATARGSVWEYFIARDLLNMIVYEDATLVAPPPTCRTYCAVFPAEEVDKAPEAGVPLIRDVRGALGRWLNGDALENSYGER